mgnify:CR=1 FL=1
MAELTGLGAASAPDAEKLFLFFRDTLQLPQVWAYQTWGEFASGGVSLGIALFGVGSVLCGLAWSMPALIAFRAVQGLGAGFAFLPVTAGIIIGAIAAQQLIPRAGVRPVMSCSAC